MRTIYGLTTGSYSDYRVQALFTDEATAKAAVEAHDKSGSRYDLADLEEFTLYEEMPELVTVWKYPAEIWEDGAVTDEAVESKTGLPWQFYEWESPSTRPRVHWAGKPGRPGRGGRLLVVGSDEQAVKQASSDNKARILAEQAGIA